MLKIAVETNIFMTVFLRCACCVFDYRTSVSTGKGVHIQRRYPARSRGHFFTSDAAIKFFYPVSCEAPRGLDASVLQSCLPVVQFD
ncbi:hypothetical protein OUZ56_016108 [Daphnia magna]|uniref:Secreted protein n=1 Tax=Daphnia magna TaxID=35525 RepID=A0ABR0APP2_9CRUS|nr:hypothetical protein OUZ56_016108 [Daphnia magna]